ncbi:DoxX family protein [Spongiivirga sp. MCCC 1A20706]|uniref:DoxX family protein n=1 Tax=Spongiivirga sp. MCCC 1A20706 TaxID=3160963 RepID=UPI003977BD38
MRITYWVSTTILCLFLLWSAYTYLLNKATIDGVRELGFPNFFRIQLAVLKIIAVLIIILPQVPLVAKDWAYGAVLFFFVTAIVAHIVHRDPFVITFINLILIAVTILSRFYLRSV